MGAAKRSLTLIGPAAVGAIVGALLFAIVGAIAQQAELGAVAGSAIGAIIGIGFTKKWVGGIVIWITVFAVLGAIIGPGCDADPLSSALVAAGIGAFLGSTGWRGLVIILAGLVGVNLGAAGGDMPGFLGLAFGVWFGWYIGYVSFRKKESDNGVTL